MRWAADHVEDLMAAWTHALDADLEHAALLAFGLQATLARSGPLPRAIEVLERTVAAGPPDRLAGYLLRWLAWDLFLQGSAAAALAPARRSVALATAVGDALLEGRACTLVASILHTLDRPDEVEGWAARALEAHERAGDEPAMASTLSTLATARWEAHRLDEAAALFTRAIAIHRAHGNEASAAVATGNLGLVVADRGDDDRGEALVLEALAAHRRVGDRVREARTLEHLARLAAKRRRFPEAVARYRASADLFAREVGRGPSLAAVLHHEGIALHQLGEPDAAAARLEEARAALGPGAHDPRLDLVLALVEADRGRDAAARALVAGAEPRTPQEVRVCTLFRVLVARALGDPLPARPEDVRAELDRELPVCEVWLYAPRL